MCLLLNYLFADVLDSTCFVLIWLTVIVIAFGAFVCLSFVWILLLKAFGFVFSILCLDLVWGVEYLAD